MNEIIKVNMEEETVSARDLYEQIGSTERFSTWFERQLQFGFEKGIDYSNPLKVLRVQNEGGRIVQREVDDYDLSMDMAKQICMVQKSEQAKRVRQYLINLEKAWNTPEQIMARAIKVAEATIAQKDKLIIEMKPKALFADAVASSNTSILIGDLAKLIKQNGIEIGQKRLFAWMRENGYLIKRQGADWNMPTQRSMEMKLFEVKESTVNNPDGSVRINKTTKVTGKGQQYFINKFLGEVA